MKNLFFFLVFLASTQLATAQMTTWTWDMYKIQFKAPSNFKVSKNDKTCFSAGNTNINLTIYPKKGVEANYDEMLSSLTNWADDSNLYYEEGAQYMDDLNRYWGCYIDGVASNGNPTTVLLLVDPDFPDIELYIWIQYQEGYLDTAVEILTSFTPH